MMRMRRLVTIAGLALVLGAQAGCLFAEPLPYDNLSIVVKRSTGTSVLGFPKCVTLPILHGSRIDESFAIDSGLRVAVSATSAAIDVTFPGATEGSTLDRHLSSDQLQRGFTETLTVSSASSSFSVTLSSGCLSGATRTP